MMFKEVVKLMTVKVFKQTSRILSLALVFSIITSLITLISPLNPTVEVNADANDLVGLENGKIYYIKNVASGGYLTALGTTNLSNVSSLSQGYNSNQQWKVVRTSDGTYSFLPQHIALQNMALDVTGTNVDIYSYSGTAASYHKFKLARVQGVYVMTKGTAFSQTTNLVSVPYDYNTNSNVLIQSFPNDPCSLW